ncbi:gamma-glutamyltransferase [Variovorax sp. YR216]|uniref:gamma-glutamyltransferase n=1 Tax=Variovorax sp. YR216 TaxID=1882828 RepID=UPI0015A15E5D|nr:gamma-glutamyltransferase [Variovorax sp. YR216]
MPKQIGEDVYLSIDPTAPGCPAALDAGRAPLAAQGKLFEAGMPQRGPRAAVVPTLVRLWARAHERFGRVPLQQLLAPAIRLAEQGVAAPEELVRNLALAGARVKSQPGFAEFMLPNGRALTAGERLLQPRLADVLRAIACEGEQGFYAGPAAQDLVRFSRDNGGLFAHRAAKNGFKRQPAGGGAGRQQPLPLAAWRVRRPLWSTAIPPGSSQTTCLGKQKAKFLSVGVGPLDLRSGRRYFSLALVIVEKEVVKWPWTCSDSLPPARCRQLSEPLSRSTRSGFCALRVW